MRFAESSDAMLMTEKHAITRPFLYLPIVLNNFTIKLDYPFQEFDFL